MVRRWCWNFIITVVIGSLAYCVCTSCAVGNKRALSSYETEERSLKFHTTGIQKALKGDYADAIVDYNQALALSPNNSEILYNRAVAYYSVGEVEKALQDFDRTIKLDSTMAQAYANRGAIRLESGDIEGARSDGQRAAALLDEQGEQGLAADIRTWLKQEVMVKEGPPESQ